MQKRDFEFVDDFCYRFERVFEQAREPIFFGHTDVSPIIAVWRHIEPMIFNGGWPSVFYNRLAWSIPKAALGYSLVGMQECADRCNRALDLSRRAESRFPGMNFASDEWLSDHLMQSISEDEWDSLDDGWYDLTRDTESHIAKYLRCALNYP